MMNGVRSSCGVPGVANRVRKAARVSPAERAAGSEGIESSAPAAGQLQKYTSYIIKNIEQNLKGEGKAELEKVHHPRLKSINFALLILSADCWLCCSLDTLKRTEQKCDLQRK